MRVANDLLLEETEMRLLLDGIRDCYGFEFRDYDTGWVRARIWDRVRAEGVQTVSGFQERVLHDPSALERLLTALAVPRAGLFADPEFFQTFRSVVVPILRTYPFAQIWQPGCSTGEDVWSLAIVLEEEGLSSRVRLYATDFSEVVFAPSREGCLAADRLLESGGPYRDADGRGSLEQYFSIEQDRAVLKPELRAMTVFSEHNLATDDVFNEFQVIVARNIIPLLNDRLQRRLHVLFSKSLSRFGVLCLGRGDGALPADHADTYQELVGNMNLYRKVESAG
jgi:chemotaxis protein methyltransferase CheR